MYDNEEAAARAYDAAIAQETDYIQRTANFTSDGALTPSAQVLLRRVLREREEQIQRDAKQRKDEGDAAVEVAEAETEAAVVKEEQGMTESKRVQCSPSGKGLRLDEGTMDTEPATNGTTEKERESVDGDGDGDEDGDEDEEEKEKDDGGQKKGTNGRTVSERSIREREEMTRREREKEEMFHSNDSRDSDSAFQSDTSDVENDREKREKDKAEKQASSSNWKEMSDSEEEEADSSEDTTSSDDSDKEDEWAKQQGEFKPVKQGLGAETEKFEPTGDVGRLLRAVNETQYAPFRSDWNNYILESAVIKMDGSKSQPITIRKVAQIDMATDEIIRESPTATTAARFANVPVKEVETCLQGKTDAAGGFKWKYTITIVNPADDEDEEDDVEEDNWKTKLHTESQVYRSGGTLRDYQVEGLSWLLRCWYTKRSSILADEMGLGKTVQVVTFLEHLFTVENLKGPFLICVPLSTIGHWKREFELWSTMVSCLYHDVGGGKDMRDVIREYEWYYKGRSRRLLKFHVLITTYDDLSRDYEELAEIPWRAVVVDEAHRLRNVNSKLLECMRSVVTKGQVCTLTPI